MGKLARIALTLAILVPSVASAQGPRWQGWIGCWSVVLTQAEPLPGRRLVCIAPTSSPDAVEMIAVADSAIITRDTIDASGRAIPVSAKGCEGSRAATWSSDQERVYLKSSVTCDGLRTNVSAILSMTTKGEWLDVRRIAAGEGSDVRVARYHDAGIPGSVPADLAQRLRAAARPRDASARIASTEPSGPSAVIDASRAVHPDVVEAWIYESGEQFANDRQSIQELARAGVPGNVSDAVIASSEAATDNGPFRSDYLAGYNRGTEQFWDQGTGMRLVGAEAPMYDPWGFGYGPFGDRVYNSTIYGSGPGYAATVNRYGRGIGYGPGGIGWGFGYGYYRKAPTGKSLIAYYAPDVPVLHQNPSGADSRTSLSAPAYPESQKAGSSSKDNTKSGGVMESVGKAIVDAATGKAKPATNKPR